MKWDALQSMSSLSVIQGKVEFQFHAKEVLC